MADTICDPSQVTVFISYSWDSPEHKKWVGKFASALRDKGIDAILDQWDTDFGDDLSLFMEKGVRDSHRVLIICTNEYVRKANAGRGGVGYERMIVTSELVKDIGTNKFIPVIRKVDEKEAVPIFLSTRKYIDFQNDNEFDEKLDELVLSLCKGPVVTKTPLGTGGAIRSLPSTFIELPATTDNPSIIYQTAISLVRSDDIMGWRKLVQKLNGSFKPLLKAWRSKYELNPPVDKPALHDAVDEAINYVAPLMVMALAGVESEKDKFKDQRALFDEIYHIVEWSRSGRGVLIELPTALGYVYQALHGAVCMHTNQYDLALKLASMKVGLGSGDKVALWQHHGLMGWSESLGRSCTDTWKYIADAFGRWGWLKEIFGSDEEYKISLICYYMLLNFNEFAQTISGHGPEVFEKKHLYLDVPLCFAKEDYGLCEKALSRLSRDPDVFVDILENWNVERSKAVQMWPRWLVSCDGWLEEVFTWNTNKCPQTKLLEHLGWK